MAKPRNSVLYMFDPLHQSPCTPQRDSSSPELGPSDKENDAPGDLTLFFGRTFAHKAHDVQVRTPKGKLIDFGDTPAPERLWEAAGAEQHDGSDADGEQSESDVEGFGGGVSPSPSPRMPLADLALDQTPRPQDPSRTAFQPLAFSPPESALPLAALLAPAPQTSPLAEVVNSINFSSLAIAEDPAAPVAALQAPFVLQEAAPIGIANRASSPFPEINVCAPETPILEEFDVPTSFNLGREAQDDHDEDEPPLTVAHLRPTSTLTQLAPDDPRRTSVDLYSSFHLQMQSAEMSFDLLNDKISFFGGAQDSFWAGADDGPEFDEVCAPPAMMAGLDRLGVQASAAVAGLPAQAARAWDDDLPAVMSPTTAAAISVPLPMSPTDSSPPSRTITPLRAPQLAVAEPLSPPTSPVVDDEPSLLLESEPLPPPVVAPVPALRIVKKTWKMVRNPSTTSASQDSTAGKKEPATKKRASLAPASVLAPAPVIAPQPVRPPIRGVQRPPIGMKGSVVIGLPSQGASSALSTGSTSSSGTSTGTKTTKPADGAAPASRFAGIQRPNLAAKERAAPRAVSAGVPRPLAGVKATAGIARAASVGAPKAAASSALRPPSRIAAPGAGSGLPKPASRLPGPSGLARTASMSAGSGSTGAGPTRARSSTLSRTATGRF